MSRLLAATLGVVTAVGGFVDIGELVAMPATGAAFRFALLPVLLLSTVGAMVYAEMAGRIELASQRTVFEIIRERIGLQIGLVVLVIGLLLNVITLIAEIGGMAFVAELVFGQGYLWFVVPMAVGLALFEFFGRWSLLENVPSFLGLALLVVPIGLLTGTIPVPWHALATHAVWPHLPTQDHVLFVTAGIAVLGAAMSPYEWYFYSSGGQEEEWTVRDLGVNRATAILGFGLGSILAVSLMVGAGLLFYPNGLQPNHLGQTGLLAAYGFGKTAIWLFLAGAFGCVLGAAIETSLAAAQGTAQFFGWPWGSSRAPRDVPAFTAIYLAAIAVALVFLLLGFDPIKVTIVSLLFGVAGLPLTLAPMLMVANDTHYMDDQTNGPLANVLGVLFLVILTVAALAAFPLVVISGGAI
jgi:Mn2+/Fe2+ NRAMP family transporter